MKSTKTGPVLTDCAHNILHLTRISLQDAGLSLYIWLELMVPTIVNGGSSNEITAHALAFFDDWSSRYDKIKNSKTKGKKKGFRTQAGIINLIHLRSTVVRNKQIDPRMDAHYEKLINMLVLDKFQARWYLPRLLPSIIIETGDAQVLLLQVLQKAISTDQVCFTNWKKQIEQNLIPTNILMNHLTENWREFYLSLKPKRKETIVGEVEDFAGHVIGTCESNQSSKNFDQNELTETINTAKELTKRIHKPERTTSYLPIFLNLILVLVVIYFIFYPQLLQDLIHKLTTALGQK